MRNTVAAPVLCFAFVSWYSSILWRF